MQFNSFSPISL